MPHIDLDKNLSGISAGFAFLPETAKPMGDLAHALSAAHEVGWATGLPHHSKTGTPLGGWLRLHHLHRAEQRP